MRKAPSLRNQLVLWIGSMLIILLTSHFIVTTSVLEEQEEEGIDAILSEQMTYSLQLYKSSGRLPAPNVPRMAFYASTHTRIPSPFTGRQDGSHEIFIGNTEYHFVTRHLNGHEFVLAYDVRDHEDRIHMTRALLGAGTLFTALLALLMIYGLSGRLLKRLSLLAKRVRSPYEGTLTEPDMEAEVLALAEALDNSLTRQHLILEREKEFSGHLSHELRTPLSVIRGEAELIGLQSGDSRMEKRSQRIIIQVDRMQALIRQMLQLARGAHHPSKQAVALATLIDTLWTDLANTGDSRTRLLNHVAPEARVEADPLLLELILHNALANARLHADGSDLHVRFNHDELSIEDCNPSPKETQGAHTESTGLGLTIVQRASDLLGWQHSLTATPEGVRLTLKIPSPSQHPHY
jgi:signal transduction histidine kinase